MVWSFAPLAVAIASCTLMLLTQPSCAFLEVSSRRLTHWQPSSVALAARKASGGKGFGKVEEPVNPSPPASPQSTPVESDVGGSPFLQSIPQGSTAIPQMDESSASPEDRAKNLLREKYGMKTYEERALDAKQQEQLEAQRKRMAELRAKADAGEDLDLIALIPGPVLLAIDRVLKGLIGVIGLTFLFSGFGITLEAWSKATNNPLPDNVDNFIVQTIEPNFTNELLALLACSISLGLLAAAQLGSESAQYRED